MTKPKWTDGGAYGLTAAGTALSFTAVPIFGLGVLALVFGGRLPGVVLSSAGVAMWFTGRWLLSR